MIDLSIPRIGLLLKDDMKIKFSDPVLPEGFSFSSYQDDTDARRWAEIMCSVGFHNESIEKGLTSFNNEFMYDKELAKKRIFFVKNEKGECVGSCTAWEVDGRHRLHWLAVLPDYQKYGIGKALVEKVLYTFQQVDSRPVYLVTQTSSHRAICLYMKEGFYPVVYSDSSRADYEQAVKVLKGVMRQDYYEEFVNNVGQE